jgi:hypothetical protein
MNVTSINISKKNLAPVSQKRLLAGETTNLKEKNVEKPVETPDLSHVKTLVANVQNSLNNTELQKWMKWSA